jgi:hypothetical protein
MPNASSAITVREKSGVRRRERAAKRRLELKLATAIDGVIIAFTELQ